MLTSPLIKKINDNEFNYFKKIIHNESGIKLSDLKKALVQSRVLKRMRMILCRNVIIYFDKQTRQELFEKLYNCFDDRGYLFIGNSESLNSISHKFKLIGETIYKKIK